jgi:CBS domain containing-hemolysin-like protein
MNTETFITAGKLVAVLVLVLMNGFFVAAEFSLVGMRRSRVEELVAGGSATARVLQGSVEKLDASLASTQLGITLSSLGLGWIGEPALAHLIEPAVQGFAWASAASHAIAIAIAFAVITTLHIVLGELAPKSLALQRTEKTALAVVRPLALFSALFRPAVAVLNWLGGSVLRLFGLHPGSETDQLHSTEELKLLVAASREGGMLEGAQQEVVERAFDMTELKVTAIMTARREVFWIDADVDTAAQMAAVRENKHEMALLCRGKVDTVLGVVRKQDLLDAHLDGRALDPSSVLRDPVIVHDGTTVLHVLELFRNRPVQMAVVIDEYATVKGIVTQTDLLEAMAGDIPADDAEQEPVTTRDDGSLLIDGSMPILRVMDRLGSPKGALTGEYQTLAGFCLRHFGGVPAVGDQFDWEGHRFEIVDLDGLRIDKVLVSHEAATGAS